MQSGVGRAFPFITAGGAVSIATGECVIRAIILTPGGAVASCSILEGGSGGAAKVALQAASNGNSAVINFGPGGLAIRDPYLGAIAGAGAVLTVVM